MAVEGIDMAEREILLYNSLKNLHLLKRAPKAEILRDLMGLQAQFSRNPEISLRLRASDYAPDSWDDGLVKVWSHRGTIHVLPEAELGLHLSAKGFPRPFGNWWRLSVDEQEEWAPFLAQQVAQGNDTRDGLKKACVAAGMDEDTLGRVFYGWGGLIQEMAWRGMLVCCTGTDKRYRVPQSVQFMPQAGAQRIFLRRYFAVYGPATTQDCAAFFGSKMAQIRPLLDEILPEMQCTVIDGTKYYHAEPLVTDGEIPACVLIPGFDQLVLGYRDRSRMLDKQHAKKLTNVAGIVFPAMLLRGRIRARWKLEGEKVIVTPFEKLLKKDEAAIKRAVKKELGVKEIAYQPVE